MKVVTRVKSFGKCPACGGDIVEGEKNFYCLNSKKVENGGKGCKVHIAKLIMGNVFDGDKVRDLFASKKLETPILEGVNSKGNGTKFRMVYDEDLKEIVPSYEDSGEKQEPLGECPKCGKNVYIGKKSFFCEGVKDQSCDFLFYRKTAGAEFTKENAEDLLAGKEIENVVCFNKDGKEYTCNFKLEGENLERIFTTVRKEVDPAE